jgi:hypothetical protein
MRHLLSALSFASLPLLLTACGPDQGGGGGGAVILCDEGEVENPVTGQCQPESNNGGGGENNTNGGGGGNNTTGNNTTGGGNNTTGGGNNVVGPDGPVDPGCVDGQYRETPPVRADLSAQLAGYSAGDLAGFSIAVLDARYPIGSYIVDGGLDSDVFQGSCVDQFVRDTSSGEAVIRQLSTVVHECGHFFDIDQGFSSRANFYAITDTLSFSCTGGDTTTRGGVTFARSRINGDAYSPLRAPCNGSRSNDCDSYADIYLDGDPDDGNFEGGDQGFNSVLEETTQYVNSLATGYAFGDYTRGSISERDGILTFLWYVERYLKMAREDYPDAYARLSGDACWREAILTVWGRAWLYLDLTEGESNLGINDDAIEALVLDPVLLGEIQRIRDAHGCGM